jgi:hypothetical protein
VVASFETDSWNSVSDREVLSGPGLWNTETITVGIQAGVSRSWAIHSCSEAWKKSEAAERVSAHQHCNPFLGLGDNGCSSHVNSGAATRIGHSDGLEGFGILLCKYNGWLPICACRLLGVWGMVPLSYGSQMLY